MRRAYRSVFLLSAVALLPSLAAAQVQQADVSHAVAGGGISVPGWSGKVDPKEAAAGATVAQAKLTKEGDALHVVTGPAITYWNPANTASGNYTVKATFKEPQFQGLNDHAHPYGVFIGGNDMGTDQQTLIYCEAYGDGRFIVRGFGPAPFMLNGGRGTPAPSINKAAAKGEPVSQEIALSVKDGKVECAVNGTVVAAFDKAVVVGAGKLKSTDGIYGFRFAHNTEGFVTGLGMTKQ
jgi:hypothetical protein